MQGRFCHEQERAALTAPFRFAALPEEDVRVVADDGSDRRRYKCRRGSFEGTMPTGALAAGIVSVDGFAFGEGYEFAERDQVVLPSDAAGDGHGYEVADYQQHADDAAGYDTPIPKRDASHHEHSGKYSAYAACHIQQVHLL